MPAAQLMMIRFRYHFVSRIPCSLAYFHSASASAQRLECAKERFRRVHAHDAAVRNLRLRFQLFADSGNRRLIGLFVLQLDRAHQHIGVILPRACRIVTLLIQLFNLLSGQFNGFDCAEPARRQNRADILLRNALCVQLSAYAVVVLVYAVAADPCSQRDQRKVAAPSPRQSICPPAWAQFSCEMTSVAVVMISGSPLTTRS